MGIFASFLSVFSGTAKAGIFAAFLSAFFATAKDVVSKKLAVQIDGTASTFASFAFAIPFYLVLLAVLLLLGHNLLPYSAAFWGLVFLRAITDVFAEWMKMHAFALGDISLVAIAFSTSPIWVVILTPLLTDDELSVSGVLGVVLVVLGSMAVFYRPSHPDWQNQKKAILLAVGASMFFGLNSIYDTLAMRPQTDAPAATSTASASEQGSPELPGAFLVKPTMAAFTMTALSAVMLTPFVVGRKDRLLGMAWYGQGLLARGFFEMTFMVAKLIAVQFMPVAYVLGIQRSSLLLSIIAGRVIFKEGDFRRRLLAGFLILGGVAWLAWIGAKEQAEKSRNTKQAFAPAAVQRWHVHGS